ncbi:transcriptional regulator, XRE family [Streptomyces iranensis]|uniref:Transcriptional regulator, XRE family n=1 Tax=Streptomyces iranensis TaxID=576784 RepID=A0A060ZYP4_9ACTN|nr:transcriptional regulator, XRE family [Streptomyces iranensis]
MSQAAGGERLPTLPVALAYVQACNGDADEWRHRWEQANAETTAVPRPPEEDDEPPYRGLERFEPGDAELFFGREETTAQLEEMARRHRLSVVVGASGSGKSSLLRAGLIPQLRRPEQDPDERPAAVLVLTPGAQPMDRLDLLTPAKGRGDTWVLVDQFEELFTLCACPEDRDAFLERLLAAREPGSRLRVVLALRADFFARCAENHTLAAALNDATLLIGPMTAEQLRAAIVRPAQARGLNVERDLTARLLDEVADEPGALPLMSHALLETWRRRRGHILTQDAYQAAGGLHGAIARTAEDAYHQLTPSQATLARRILLRLIAPGDGTEDTHRPTPRTEFAAADSGGHGRHDAVLDRQFEEVFTLCTSPDDRAAFLERLLAAREPGSRLRVVLALRADFFVRCTENHALAAAINDATLLVGPMATAQLRAAIVRPAQARGLNVERDLTARLLQEVTDEPGALPLMSHALLETWRRRRGHILTQDAYQAAGGLHGAIARTAEDAYHQLTPSQTTLARRILLRLIAPGDGTEDTHRPTPRAEFAAADPGITADTDAVLDRLARARLLTVDEGTVFLAHEKLITAWPRLQGWINEERDRIRLHRQLTHDALAWRDLEHDAGALYRGSRLVQADEAFTDHSPEVLNPLEAAFLDTSVAAGRRHERRTRRTLITLSTLLCLALLAALVAYQQRNDAEQQRRLAVSRELAARAGQLSEQHPEAAMVIALRGYRQASTTDARSSLLSSYARFYANQFTGHTKTVEGMAFAPNGRTLATASMDHSVKLWDTESHHLLATLTGHTDIVNAVAFSPDGRTLATASNDRSVKLWDTRSHRLLATLTGHTNTVEGVAFSPDGRTLASASSDRTVRLWDARTHRQRALLTGHTDSVMGLAFSPNGRMLASAGGGRTTRLWDVSSHKTLGVLAGRTGAVNAVAFSPDGRTLATASNDRSVKLWDTRSHRLLATLTGHTNAVEGVAFSPDGRTLATASMDGTVRLWRPQTREPLATLNEKPPVMAVAFSPDGRTLASTGKESTARLWNVASRRPVATLSGRSGAMTSQATFVDRHAFLRVDYDVSATSWSTARPRTRPAPIRAPKPFVTFVASSDSTAVAGHDRVIRVWSLATGRRIATLPAGTGMVRHLAITPDGRTLAVGSDDGTIRVWDVAARRTTAVLRGAAARSVNVLALRPEGRALAAVSTDGTTYLWATRSGQTATPLPGPKNAGQAPGLQPPTAIPLAVGQHRSAPSTVGRARRPRSGRRQHRRHHVPVGHPLRADRHAPARPQERGPGPGLQPRRPYPGRRQHRWHRPTVGRRRPPHRRHPRRPRRPHPRGGLQPRRLHARRHHLQRRQRTAVGHPHRSPARQPHRPHPGGGPTQGAFLSQRPRPGNPHLQRRPRLEHRRRLRRHTRLPPQHRAPLGTTPPRPAGKGPVPSMISHPSSSRDTPRLAATAMTPAPGVRAT